MALLDYKIVLEDIEESKLTDPMDWCDKCWPFTRGATWSTSYIIPTGVTLTYGGWKNGYTRIFYFQRREDAAQFLLTWGGKCDQFQ